MVFLLSSAAAFELHLCPHVCTAAGQAPAHSRRHRPLYYYTAEGTPASESFLTCTVPRTINRYLRSYQREGIQFMFRRVLRGCSSASEPAVVRADVCRLLYSVLTSSSPTCILYRAAGSTPGARAACWPTTWAWARRCRCVEWGQLGAGRDVELLGA